MIIIWRFQRLCALIDKVESPEDMQTFIFNHLSVAQFWRSWHSSFNYWVLRYLYGPLGGSKKGKKRQLINVFLVFLFVALMHKNDWNIIAWALATVLGFSVELFLRAKAKQYQSSPNYFWIKYLIAWVLGFEVIFQLIANNLSFVVGTEKFIKIYSVFFNFQGKFFNF